MIRWLFSKTIRQAVMMRKHVRKLLNHQRDILSPQAIGGITLAMNELDATIAEGANTGKIRIKMEELEFAANKWLKTYPNAVWRENIEVLLVALAVAMGIRTFFLQPFKIPTGSMQPTLYGVTSAPNFCQTVMEIRGYEQSKDYLDEKTKAVSEQKIRADINQQIKERNTLAIPTGWRRIRDWFEGYSYIHVVANEDGRLGSVEKPVHFLIFSLWQKIIFNGKPITIWFPPDYGEQPLQFRAGLQENEFFRKGDDVIKMRVQSGDHLFVDRFTYNFRPPKRGEVIVFDTHGITQLAPDQQDTFYIKRLVGLGGETLKIQQDYVVTNVPNFGTVPGRPFGRGRQTAVGFHAAFLQSLRIYERASRPESHPLPGKPILRACHVGSPSAWPILSCRAPSLFCDGRQHHEQLRFALLGRFP